MGDALIKRTDTTVSEKAQYALTFGVVSVLLYFIGFPVFGIALLGASAFLVIKLFSSTVRSDTRKIFEFYLTANEILRDDNRRWYGFEIKEAISLGEKLVAAMHTAPTLLHFAIGALYAKSGDHSSAVKHLRHVFEETSADESAVVFPTPEVRDYVRLLRRIEREPAESPLTSAAVRSLERIRTNRGLAMLNASREYENNMSRSELDDGSDREFSSDSVVFDEGQVPNGALTEGSTSSVMSRAGGTAEDSKTVPHRKPITEVLHDIYDKKVH
ncbi:MAG: hypothetical protein IPG67_18815 [Acidobacteria bacterium]|nr:hypothetical protein [Acidobacteriota bacterium]